MELMLLEEDLMELLELLLAPPVELVVEPELLDVV